MSSEIEAVQFTMQIGAGEDADAEELDRLTRQLRGELQDLGVESAELVKGGPAPGGSKSVEAVTAGAIAVAVLPTFLPKLVEFIQAWALRGQGRTVKFKGKVAGQEVEFEGSAEDLKPLLVTLSALPTQRDKPANKSKPSR